MGGAEEAVDVGEELARLHGLLEEDVAPGPPGALLVLLDAHRALQHLRGMADALAVVIGALEHGFLAVDPAFAAIDTVYGMGYRWVEGA